MAKGKKTGGRQKGTPNIVTTDMKYAIIEAFHQLGGVQYLIRLGNDDPRTFAGLLKPMIPLEIQNLDKNGKPADAGYKIIIEHVDVKK